MASKLNHIGDLQELINSQLSDVWAEISEQENDAIAINEVTSLFEEIVWKLDRIKQFLERNNEGKVLKKWNKEEE